MALLKRHKLVRSLKWTWPLAFMLSTLVSCSDVASDLVGPSSSGFFVDVIAIYGEAGLPASATSQATIRVEVKDANGDGVDATATLTTTQGTLGATTLTITDGVGVTTLTGTTTVGTATIVATVENVSATETVPIVNITNTAT